MIPGLDVDALGRWLGQEHPDLMPERGALSARLITGGLSNLSYRIDGGAQPWVLRRPPLGHVLSTAHDMGREYRVISALHGGAVPVPEARVHHRDEDGSAGVGAEFFIMDFVDGRTLGSRADNTTFSRGQLGNLGPMIATVLADLHEIAPGDVGLEGFGRPDGFLERQVSRWRRQLDQSRSRDVPALDRLAELVSQHIPDSAESSIVHGDFRLDNALVALRGSSVTVSAVLDWEMSTLGDPLTDLGLLGIYWDLHATEGAAESPLASAIDPAAGYASFTEIVDTYSSRRRMRVPPLRWYLAFGALKLSIILEGIHYRYTLGQTVGEGFNTIGRLVPGVAETGLDHLGQTGATRAL